MNLAAILLQLFSMCGTLTGSEYAEHSCKNFMKECAVKNYQTQETENTSDLCIKKYLKEIK